MLNIEMKDFLENEDTSDFSHTRMNIYFRELGNESPLLVKLIMQSIYKNNDRKVRHLGSKRFGIQFLIKGIYTYNGMLYVHTQTKNSSNVPFDTDFIRFKITDKKVPKRTAIQETVLDAVRSYNEVIEIAGNRPCARCTPCRSSPFLTTSCWSWNSTRRTAGGIRPYGWRTPTS